MPPRYPEEIAQLFRERPKLRFIKPDPKPEQKPINGISGILTFIKQNQLTRSNEQPPLPINEARILRREKRAEANREKIERMKEHYNPTKIERESDPYKTLFVGNLPENATEANIRHEFEPFGKVKSISMVTDTVTGKQKNYCFVEYETETAFRNAMAHKDHTTINNQIVVVDCERNRTVKDWLPRKLGGGLGGEQRRFAQSKLALQCQFQRKRKRPTWKSSRRFRGVLDDVKKRREEKLGISRQNKNRKNSSAPFSKYTANR